MSRFGCRFALDDFGSGHTSYGHLKNLRADVLKIDGSFVKDIVDNPADFAIVKSMNDIAHIPGHAHRGRIRGVASPSWPSSKRSAWTTRKATRCTSRAGWNSCWGGKVQPPQLPQPASAPLTRVLDSAVAVA